MRTPCTNLVCWSSVVLLALGVAACAGSSDTGSSRGEPSASSDDDKAALSVVFDGKRHVIDKDRFVIGSSPDADLVIDHESVQPEHAAVLREDNGYRIKDLGGGIDFKKMRIDNKSIDDGDAFVLGEVEIVFSL